MGSSRCRYSRFYETLMLVIKDTINHMQDGEYFSASNFSEHYNFDSGVLHNLFFELEHSGWFNSHGIEVSYYHFFKDIKTKIYIKNSEVKPKKNSEKTKMKMKINNEHHVAMECV